MNDPLPILGWICLAILIIPVFGYYCVMLWTHAYVTSKRKAQLQAFQEHSKPRTKRNQSLNEGDSTDASPKSS